MSRRSILRRITTKFRSDDRGVSQLIALGILLGSALVLAVALGVFVLVGG